MRGGPREGKSGPDLAHSLCLVASLVLASSCTSLQDEFIGVRVQDTCNGNWPVCDTTVGCMVGDRSYVQGRFPGTARVAYQLFEPSTVTVSFLLTEIAGSGDLTTIHFYEDQCRSRVRTEVPGKTFVGEAQQLGIVKRETDLSGIGDHLLEVISDARLRYLMKVDVTPLRLKDSPGSQ
jgi:hypothetical protein